MRAPAERTKIETALRVLGRRVTDDHTIYLAGGTSAVLVGWRDSTLDMDVRPEPDSDALLRERSRGEAPRLFRFPGVDAPSFLGRVRAFLGD